MPDAAPAVHWQAAEHQLEAQLWSKPPQIVDVCHQFVDVYQRLKHMLESQSCEQRMVMTDAVTREVYRAESMHTVHKGMLSMHTCMSFYSMLYGILQPNATAA